MTKDECGFLLFASFNEAHGYKPNLLTIPELGKKLDLPVIETNLLLHQLGLRQRKWPTPYAIQNTFAVRIEGDMHDLIRWDYDLVHHIIYGN